MIRSLIYFTFVMTFFCSVAYAEFYIVNQDNQVIGKLSYQPDQKDLGTRKEIWIESKLDVPLDQAEYRGGTIVQHVPTTAETAAATAETDKINELNIVQRKAYKLACDQLVTDGMKFTVIKCEDFGK